MKTSSMIVLLFLITKAKGDDLEGVPSDHVKEESKMWLSPLLICDCPDKMMK